MPTYVLYDTTSGRVLGLHREILVGSEETADLTDEEVVTAAGTRAADGAKVGILAVREHPRPRKGHRLFVDPNLRQLVELEVE